MRKLLLLTLFIVSRQICICQDEASEKAGLLMTRCSFEPGAEIMVLKDEAEISVNNDLSLRLDRHVTFKFFSDKKIDRQLAEAIFYPSPFFEKYYRFDLRTVELDPGNKSLIPRDYTAKINSVHIQQLGIRVRAGALLEVSYAINFPYDEKVPDWRFQSQYPSEYSSVRLLVPEMMQLRDTLLGGFSPEEQHRSEALRQVRIDNQNRTVKVSERYYQYAQLPSAMPEPFADHSPGQLQRLHMHVVSVMRGEEVIDDFASAQVERIFEALSSRPDFLLRLSGPLDIKSDYDKRVRSITDPREKLARIYDLVRRHITWDRVDSLAAGRPLARVWADKKGNSTEINLVLVKLLDTYGYDASPLVLSTRSNGPIDTGEVDLGDFNRTVAYVRLGGKGIVLDATGRSYDFPAIPVSILNTRGLLISMDRNRWVEVVDTGAVYRSSVTLLGHLSGDSAFLTNVYVNSSGYAKPEHVDILETDSLKGLRGYFERGNAQLRFRHFIVANEYVDTLPLAQEWDIKVPLHPSDNLTGMVPTWFSIPDTLFTIREDRKCGVNFGYRQEYDLVSEFTYPDNYELYLLPKNIQLSALNGSVHFEREYHPGETNFSLRQSLVIDKSHFSKAESMELAKFLKKVAALNVQEVMLKKNYIK